MTLREQLAQILPDVLPEDPVLAVNGTTLLGEVRRRLEGVYTDASIRQHFSVMAADATSPIARVSQGHGYYKRLVPIVPEVLEEEVQGVEGGAMIAPGGPAPDGVQQAGGRNNQREEKFRAVYVRYEQINNRFPAHIEHTAAARQAAGVNKWKFPDVIVLEWNVGRVADAGYQIEPGLLEVKKSLGDPPFRLASVELKVELTLSSFRENFFQCVSNSKWAHHAYLVTANAVQDETLVRELRRLGASFDISVISFGLSNQYLDELPPADEILGLDDQKFEGIASEIAISGISSGRPRETLDWEHIEDVRTQSGDFNEVFAWISHCLRSGRALSITRHREIIQGQENLARLQNG